MMWPFNTMMWPFEADTVEYGEWKSGIRTEGPTYAIFSIDPQARPVRRWRYRCFRARLGWLRVQGRPPERRRTLVRPLRSGAAPGHPGSLAVSIMWFYPLTERKFKEIVADVAARRQNGGPLTHSQAVLPTEV